MVTNRSIAKKAIIKQREIIKIVPIEFEKNTQISVMIEQEMADPIIIASIDFQTFKLLIPAIKLPVQTPVSGNGIATNPHNIRYFLNVEVCFSSCLALTENFFELTRSTLVLDLQNLVKEIIAKLGIIEPKNANMHACQAGSAFVPQKRGFIAKGIAILVSSVGIIASKIQASQIQL